MKEMTGNRAIRMKAVILKLHTLENLKTRKAISVLKTKAFISPFTATNINIEFKLIKSKFTSYQHL